MTRTARLAILHLFHGRFIGSALGLKHIGMAFVTAEHIGVSGVLKSV